MVYGIFLLYYVSYIELTQRLLVGWEYVDLGWRCGHPSDASDQDFVVIVPPSDDEHYYNAPPRFCCDVQGGSVWPCARWVSRFFFYSS